MKDANPRIHTLVTELSLPIRHSRVSCKNQKIDPFLRISEPDPVLWSRKIRIPAKGRGKRGGGRIIYYFFVSTSRIALLLAYPKNAQGDLTAAQKKILIKVIETWS